jgi:serine/threonine protein kinase
VERIGPYKVRRKIAEGGMAVVYLAEKVGPEGFVKPVVLKCILPGLAVDKPFVQLFLDEARLAALLNHPNIAQIFDFGVADDVYYLAMEYVPGYTCDDIRRKHASIGRKFPVEHAAFIASQVASGLHYAHALQDAKGASLGLVHRDVSPQNILVSVDGAAKLVDFGIAKARAGLARVEARGAVGKFGYMSPEQALGEVADRRSDVFSLGVCIFELLSNERLHSSQLDRPPVYDKHVPIPLVTTRRTDVPRKLAQIVAKSLAIDPQDRFQSCQDLHVELERFLTAMDHYAGEKELAGYLKLLAAGQIEQPDQQNTGIVSAPTTGDLAPLAKDNLSGAEKFEEVFGFSDESDKAEPKLGVVPAFWKKSRKKAGSGSESTDDAEPKAGRGKRLPDETSLELAFPVELSRRVPPKPKRKVLAKPPARPSWIRGVLRRWPVVFSTMVLGCLLVFGVASRNELLRLVRQTLDWPEPPQADGGLTSRYRVTTNPAGAYLELDGKRVPGVTPVEVVLIPGVTYQLALTLAGRATEYRTVVAATAQSVQTIDVNLSLPATLFVSSEPPGARLRIGGVVREERTPAVFRNLPTGRPIEVTAQVQGVQAQTQNITLKAGQKSRLRFVLYKN